MMKRFDTAVEISKQLITISLAVLVGIAALTGNILVNESDGKVFTCLVILYSLLAISILAGIVHLGAILNLVETVERNEHEKKNEFVSPFDNPIAVKSCAAQQICFALSVIIMVTTLIIDRSIM
jgi:Na+/alanine symporter